MASLYDIEVVANDGSKLSMAQYQGKTLLIVNTASKCGFTPQYQELQQLYETFQGREFEVLAFPCNQFGKQEPDSDPEIASFCQLNFGVTFPLFKKIEVNGPDAAPLFKYLKHQAPGIFGTEGIKWNFTKFLVPKDGSTITRFASKVSPKSLESKIKQAL